MSLRRTIAVMAAAVAATAGAGLVVVNNYACGCVPPKPEPQTAPTIQGTDSPTPGDVLTTGPGTWVNTGNLAGYPNTAYNYRWLACDTNGDNCKAATGITNTCAGDATVVTCAYTVANPDYGTRLRVAVSATNAGGTTIQNSPPTAVVGGSAGVPGAPTAFTATAGDGRVDLAWTAPNCTGCTLGPYHIYRDGTEVATTTNTTFPATGLANGTTYAFAVAASNSTGALGDQSPTQSATPTPPPPPGTPAAPGNLVATAGDGRVDLNWTASTCACTLGPYHVYRNGADVATTTSTNYADTGRTNNTTYSYYVVGSNNVGGLGTASATVTATPTSPVTGSHTVPASPSGPGIPSGGWSVEYADAFGSCLNISGTLCSAGYPRNDTTWASPCHNGTKWNSNELPTAFTNGMVDVTPAGLDLVMMKNGPAGCIWGNGAGSPYNWHPSGSHFVLQFRAILPENTGNMDQGVWATGLNYAWEYDIPEYWGWGYPWNPPPGANWCASGMTFPGVPVGGGGQTPVKFTCSGNLPNPSLAYHTYTEDMNAGTFTSYVDGHQVASKGGIGGSAIGKLILQNDARQNAGTGGNYLPAKCDFILSYIVMYEPSSAGHANSNGPKIVSGTSIK